MSCDKDVAEVVQAGFDQPGVGGMQATTTWLDQLIRLPVRQDEFEVAGRCRR